MTKWESSSAKGCPPDALGSVLQCKVGGTRPRTAVHLADLVYAATQEQTVNTSTSRTGRVSAPRSRPRPWMAGLLPESSYRTTGWPWNCARRVTWSEVPSRSGPPPTHWRSGDVGTVEVQPHASETQLSNALLHEYCTARETEVPNGAWLGVILVGATGLEVVYRSPLI